MKTKWMMGSFLALSLVASGVVLAKANAAAQGPPPQGAYAQETGGWDVPPHEFSQIQQQGFRDGVEGARKDFDHHRAPNVEDRAEYRHPHVDASARDDYREGFRRGYDAAMNHLEGH